MISEDFHKKIEEIKKQGRFSSMEQKEIKKIKREHFAQFEIKSQRLMLERLYKNIRYLELIHKTPLNEETSRRYAGKFVNPQKYMDNYEYLRFNLLDLASYVYCIPQEYLLYHDLEAYGEEIIKNKITKYNSEDYNQTFERK